MNINTTIRINDLKEQCAQHLIKQEPLKSISKIDWSMAVRECRRWVDEVDRRMPLILQNRVGAPLFAETWDGSESKLTDCQLWALERMGWTRNAASIAAALGHKNVLALALELEFRWRVEFVHECRRIPQTQKRRWNDLLVNMRSPIAN